MALLLALPILMGIQAPPARYDHPPKIPVVVVEVADPNRVCRGLSGYRGGSYILACALLLKTRCVIIWPEGQKQSGLLWRHEIGHCNGWPANHPR